MGSGSVTKEKLLLIGIDGATFDVIDPLLKAGRLPNLSRLMDNGCRAKLKSLIIPTSPLSWSSIVTGKNPGKHGIFHFTEKPPGHYNIRFVNASLRHGHTIWHLINHHRKKVIILNVPITYPPDPVSGAMVSGFDAPDEKSNYTFPATLAEDIRKWVGPYTIDLRLRSSVTKGKRSQILNDARLMEEKKAEVACKLMKQINNWDFFMVVFNICDRIQHWFWQYMDNSHPNYNAEDAEIFGNAIYQSYEIIDQLVGELLLITPEGIRVMVISDHGFGPATNKAFYLNDWLQKQGFLYFHNRSTSYSSISKKVGHRVRTHFIKWLPRQWKGSLKRWFPNLKSGLISYLSFSGIDWSRTKAFSSEVDNFIYMNVKGREPEGVIELQDYERYRNDISEVLYLLKDPDTGDQVIDKVYKREELYHGPFVEKAPDLIFTFMNNGYRVRPSQEVAGGNGNCIKLYKAENWASGNHRMEGIFTFSGPGIKGGNNKLTEQSILNVAPTVLYSLGLPVPDDMDGKVILEAFDMETQRKKDIQYEHSLDKDVEKNCEPYDEKESEMIEERLRDLGYLD